MCIACSIESNTLSKLLYALKHLTVGSSGYFCASFHEFQGDFCGRNHFR
jgi:hypothetical protein